MELTRGTGSLEVRHSSNPAMADNASSSFEDMTKEDLAKADSGKDEQYNVLEGGSTAESSFKTTEDLNNWLIGGNNDPLIEQNRDDVEQLVKAILSTEGEPAYHDLYDWDPGRCSPQSPYYQAYNGNPPGGHILGGNPVGGGHPVGGNPSYSNAFNASRGSWHTATSSRPPMFPMISTESSGPRQGGGSLFCAGGHHREYFGRTTGCATGEYHHHRNEHQCHRNEWSSPLIRGAIPNSNRFEIFLYELRRFLDVAAEILSSSSSGSLFALNAMQKHTFPTINRWRNVDLDLPVVIPCGVLRVKYEEDEDDEDSQGSLLCASSSSAQVDYQFRDEHRALRYVGDRDKILGMFSNDVLGMEPVKVNSNLLCTRLAVLHKCPDFLLPIVAKALLVSVISCERVVDMPIKLLCTKVSRCSVSQKAPATDEYKWCERVEALMEPVSQIDETRLSQLNQALSGFAYLVNEPIRSMVRTWYSQVCASSPLAKAVPVELFNPEDESLGLSFRWAPSKQMKVLLAFRYTAWSSSLFSKRIDSPGFQTSEVRLEHERRNDQQWDPTLLEIGHKVPCKKLLQSPEGQDARVVLCDPKQISLPDVQILKTSNHRQSTVTQRDKPPVDNNQQSDSKQAAATTKDNETDSK